MNNSSNTTLSAYRCSTLLVIVFLSGNLLCQSTTPTRALGNHADKLALINFKRQIGSDPHRVLSSWNDSLHFCNWFGITCSHRHRRVTSIALQGQNLFGTISPYVGNLSFLSFLNLRNNSLHGEIPAEVGNLFRLQQLLLNNNTLRGEVPINLTRCSKLRVIALSWNSLVGKIPAELGSLAKLQKLELTSNNLTGEFPPALGNLTLLAYFAASYNNLEGSIPYVFGRLKRLSSFFAGINKLSGIIPPSFYNISSLVTILTMENQLEGTFPANIGHTLRNVQRFGMGNNSFFGSIPDSLSNASQLQILDVGFNNFVGRVPTNLGHLQSLWWIRLSGNNLGSNSADDWEFLTSLKNCSRLQRLSLSSANFSSALPNSIANLSTQLTQLDLSNNRITGAIPAGLSNLVNLTSLDMENNFLAGVIPVDFGKFQKLQTLRLSGNSLSGPIPSSLGNLTQIFRLELSNNKLEGEIPPSIGDCQNLNSLDLSQNNLSGAIPQKVIGLSSLSLLLNLSRNSLNGTLPVEVGELKNIYAIDISENNLSGDIPHAIGDCSSLTHLFVQGNSFKGIIPSSLASLRGLQRLDLSRNNLSGKIPKEIQDVPFLQYLNLSFNDLEGEVPTEGIFKNASVVSLTGNDRLCGGVPELGLPKCSNRATKRGGSLAFKLTVIVTVPVLFSLLISSFVASFWLRRSRKTSPFAPSPMVVLLKLSYKELHQATSGFSPSNFIGAGSFASVYRGFIDQVEKPVAIKVLNLQQKGAHKSFITECMTLKDIRHRNLVKIITYCSSLDHKGDDFKALVYEFMINGTLEKWLHSESLSRSLTLLQRLNIAIDVASALFYLHDLCENPIVHCDLKPSNILLDEDMIAHVSDFGLSRILSSTNESNSSTIGFKGTIGYAAPEYGMSGAASKKGDVYSYGILLLEMFSGRRPTDEMFKNGLNLHDFVKAALPKRLMQIVDPALIRETEEMEAVGAADNEDEDDEIVVGEETNSDGSVRQMNPNVHMCLLSILELGVSSSATSPKERMNMGDITKKLHSIRNAFLSE